MGFMVNFTKAKNPLKQVRALVVIGWISLVCICYGYYYVQTLLDAYPVLQRARELGLVEMVRRYITP